MQTSDEILAEITAHLEEHFEVSPSKCTFDAHLFRDLDLDSLDAIDLSVALYAAFQVKMTPEDFKTLHTLGDVITLLQKRQQEHGA